MICQSAEGPFVDKVQRRTAFISETVSLLCLLHTHRLLKVGPAATKRQDKVQSAPRFLRLFRLWRSYRPYRAASSTSPVTGSPYHSRVLDFKEAGSSESEPCARLT